MPLTVSLPKVVKIANTRLAILYYTLLTAVVVGCVMLIFYEKKYLIRESPTTFPSLYLTIPTEKLDETIKNETGADGFCSKFGAGNYSFEFDQSFTYHNITCIEEPLAVSYSKQSGQTYFMPTYFSMEYILTDTSDSTVCTSISSVPCESTIPATGCSLTPAGRPCTFKRREQFWPVGTLLAQLFFHHSYEVEGGIWDSGTHKASSSTEDGIDSRQIRTYIVVDDGSVDGTFKEFDCDFPKAGQCHFDPGQTISISLQKALEVANITSLDAENTKQDSRNGTHPTIRLTGTQLSITAEYKNSWFHAASISNSESSWSGVHCYIKFAANMEWTSRIENTYIDPSFEPSTTTKVRQRYEHGIQLVFAGAQTSEFGFFNTGSLVAIIAVILIYIRIVPTIIKQIALRLLGNTSRTYKRAQQELLKVEESCCRNLPAKVLSSAVTFYMISRMNDMDPGQLAEMDKNFSGGISKEIIQFLLTHSMNEEKSIDANEMQNIVDSIYDGLRGDDHVISLNEFIRAVNSNEVFDMDSLVHTFDVQRKRNIFERIFADETDRAVGKERTRREKLGEEMGGSEVSGSGARRRRTYNSEAHNP